MAMLIIGPAPRAVEHPFSRSLPPVEAPLKAPRSGISLPIPEQLQLRFEAAPQPFGLAHRKGTGSAPAAPFRCANCHSTNI
jgi:hypothetical protein